MYSAEFKYLSAIVHMNRSEYTWNKNMFKPGNINSMTNKKVINKNTARYN